MSMVAVCDGCGKQEPADTNGIHWFKPRLWYERTPAGENRPITACSRGCIETVEEKRKAEGKDSTTAVLPV